MKRWAIPAEGLDDGPDLFVARATYKGRPEAITKRYRGIISTVSVDFAPGTPASVRRGVVAAIQAIPPAFKGFAP